MSLHVVARSRLLGQEDLLNDTLRTPSANEDDDEDRGFRSRAARDNLTIAVPLAHHAAQILRDLRE